MCVCVCVCVRACVHMCTCIPFYMVLLHKVVFIDTKFKLDHTKRALTDLDALGKS